MYLDKFLGNLCFTSASSNVNLVILNNAGNFREELDFYKVNYKELNLDSSLSIFANLLKRKISIRRVISLNNHAIVKRINEVKIKFSHHDKFSDNPLFINKSSRNCILQIYTFNNYTKKTPKLKSGLGVNNNQYKHYNISIYPSIVPKSFF